VRQSERAQHGSLAKEKNYFSRKGMQMRHRFLIVTSLGVKAL